MTSQNACACLYVCMHLMLSYFSIRMHIRLYVCKYAFMYMYTWKPNRYGFFPMYVYVYMFILQNLLTFGAAALGAAAGAAAALGAAATAFGLLEALVPEATTFFWRGAKLGGLNCKYKSRQVN